MDESTAPTRQTLHASEEKQFLICANLRNLWFISFNSGELNRESHEPARRMKVLATCHPPKKSYLTSTLPFVNLSGPRSWDDARGESHYFVCDMHLTGGSASC
jgi:hypothetical protein